MTFDPYKTHRAGRVSANLQTAENALSDAFVDAYMLDKELARAVEAARAAVHEARKIDLWEIAR